MNKPLILVVEDDSAVSNLIATTLETHEYFYITESLGEQALKTAIEKKPDIMLLDLGLPDMDGVSVIKMLRSRSNIPVIVISARGEDSDKISALDCGADDYITKPFSVEELLARLRATLRRLSHSSGDLEPSIFVNGELKIDYAACSVYMGDKMLHLTPIEYRLLCLLAENAGKVLTHTTITREIWGSTWDCDLASLRVFMAQLRKKIEKHPSAPEYIQTHVGIGYRMPRK